MQPGRASIEKSWRSPPVRLVDLVHVFGIAAQAPVVLGRRRNQAPAEPDRKLDQEP
jgi:hypothetical protein